MQLEKQLEKLVAVGEDRNVETERDGYEEKSCADAAAITPSAAYLESLGAGARGAAGRD